MFQSVGRRISRDDTSGLRPKFSITSGLEETRFIEKVPSPTTPPIPELNLPDDENELRPLK